MIHYDIDTTENAYCNIEGDVESLNELKQILFKNDVVPDLVGYLTFDNLPNVSICISAQKELGFFISITDDENTYLTLGDKNALNETIDVWGDGLYISKGLFILHLRTNMPARVQEPSSRLRLICAWLIVARKNDF